MELGLKGKFVLCMASAAGLGKGIATEMAREGAKVMLCTAEPFKDQLLEAQAEIEKETGNRPETFLCDVNKAEDIEALVKHTEETLGDIYALVNMCPGPKPGPFESFDDAAWTNAFNMCRTSVHETSRRRPHRKLHFLFRQGLPRQPDPLQHHENGRCRHDKDTRKRSRKRQYPDQCHRTGPYRNSKNRELK